MSYSSVILATSGLQSYWRLNETSGTSATDSKGSVTGTYYGSPTLNNATLITGDAAKAPLFSKSVSSQGVDMGDIYGEVGTVSFSWECVFKASAVLSTNNYQKILAKNWYTSSGDNGGVYMMLFNDGTNNLIFFQRQVNVAIQVPLPTYNSASALTNGTIYHVVGTYDGVVLRLYVNGCLIAAVKDSGSVASPTTTTHFRVGNIGTGSGNTFDGNISEAAVYNVTLDASTIYNHYLNSIASSPSANNTHWAGVLVTSETNSPYDSTNPLSVFNTLIGQNAQVVNVFVDIGSTHDYTHNLTSGFVTMVRNSGANLHITLEPWDSANTSLNANYKLTNIVNGNFDTQFTNLANYIKGLGYTVYIRLMHEANGNWYPWSVGSGNANSNTVTDYKNAWAHIQTQFSNAGCTNVKWIWNLNNWFSGSAIPSAFYPGDGSVDIVSIDGYNNGTDGGSDGIWHSGMEVFALTYQMLQTLTTKKVFISEYGCSENGGTKSSWYTQLLGTDFPTYLTNMIGAIAFDQDNTSQGTSNYKVDTTTASKNAYIAQIVTGGKYADVPPFPEITNLSPAIINQNSGSQNLTVTGFGYVSGQMTSTVGGNSRTVSSVTGTGLTIALLSSDVATLGNIPVIVTRASEPYNTTTVPSDTQTYSVIVNTNAPSGSDAFGIVEGMTLSGAIPGADTATWAEGGVTLVGLIPGSDLFAWVEASIVSQGFISSDLFAWLESGMVQKSLAGPVVNFTPPYVFSTFGTVPRTTKDMVDIDYINGIMVRDALGRPKLCKGLDMFLSRLVRAYLLPKGGWCLEPKKGSAVVPGLVLRANIELQMADVASYEAKKWVYGGISKITVDGVQETLDPRIMAVTITVFMSDNSRAQAVLNLQAV